MLKVTNLCKSYPSFSLKDVSFELESGYIMGFIGMNGAGKSTTLKSILNIVKPDSGNVEILGKSMKNDELDIKEQLGFMLDSVNYYKRSKIKTIINVYKTFFKEWDDAKYHEYIKMFKLDEEKRVFELSQGMKVKLGLTMALSHNAKLIILDEPTSGLDPIARDEILDIFQSIVEDGTKSILFSTHITSDLDKCADFIIFIKDGKIITNSTKDDLIDSHKLIEGKNEDLTNELLNSMVGYKKNKYGFKGLIKSQDLKDTYKVQVEVPNLEDIMVYYNTDSMREE